MWANSVFFRPCLDFITRLNKQIGPVNLLEYKDKAVKKPMRRAIYMELNDYWYEWEGSHFTKRIHINWNKELPTSMMMR